MYQDGVSIRVRDDGHVADGRLQRLEAEPASIRFQ